MFASHNLGRFSAKKLLHAVELSDGLSKKSHQSLRNRSIERSFSIEKRNSQDAGQMLNLMTAHSTNAKESQLTRPTRRFESNRSSNSSQFSRPLRYRHASLSRSRDRL